MKKVFLFILPLMVAIACSGPKTAEDVNVAQAKELIMNDDVVLLDVRSDDEWDGGYIDGAIHVNYHEDDFDARLAELPKDKEYVVYCHAGGRSAKTVTKMKEAGFEMVHNLSGGISAWKSEGNDIVQ